MSATTSNDQSVDYMRQVQTQQRAGEHESGVLRNLYKRAKSDGEDVDAMRRAIRKLRSQEPEAIIAGLRAEIRYLQLRLEPRGQPITFEQLLGNFTPTLTQKSRELDGRFDAEEAGWRAGRMGVPREDCPYPVGSEFAQAWGRWWLRGQEAIAKEMGPDAQVASVSREHPSRMQKAGGNGAKAPKAAVAKAKRRGRPPKAAAGKAQRKNGRKAKPRLALVDDSLPGVH